ncbi:MAG TPA: hypothetical protein V6C71_11225 [Coleofasciculaceae cyanobacterium]|jgi:RsiW-degrading membrane proteinase PrsW (M82 family)
MTFYLTGAGAYCVFLLLCKFKDRECSKTDPTSWIVVAIASALWIVVMPISLSEIRTKARTKARTAKRYAMVKPVNSVENLHQIETVYQRY